MKIMVDADDWEELCKAITILGKAITKLSKEMKALKEKVARYETAN